MKLKEYFGYMKEEWEFHKRNPVLFIFWAAWAYALYIVLKDIK